MGDSDFLGAGRPREVLREVLKKGVVEGLSPREHRDWLGSTETAWWCGMPGIRSGRKMWAPAPGLVFQVCGGAEASPGARGFSLGSAV